jgi:hypothetical protein
VKKKILDNQEDVCYNSCMGTEKKPQRKRGPVPGLNTAQYTLMLEPEPAEWGKTQPGGLSELVRRLLREEYEKQVKP